MRVIWCKAAYHLKLDLLLILWTKSHKKLKFTQQKVVNIPQLTFFFFFFLLVYLPWMYNRQCQPFSLAIQQAHLHGVQ